MSNKADVTTMKQATKSELKPKLRFPEFRDAGEWEKKPLDDIAVFFKGKGISKSDIDFQGETPCIRYGELYTIYGEVISMVVSKTKLPSSELFLSQKNDVLIPSSGETKWDIAKASCVLLDDIALGGDLNVLRPNGNGIFLSYLLNGACKSEIAKKAQGDTVVHLYASQLKLLDVMVPKEPEQQKIADCLSSLDELISAQTQKLATLKTHKKGLMQQLFPAEGETLPKLRFPEFRDVGEWDIKRLTEVCEKISQGGTPDTSNPDYWNGFIEWLTPAEMGKLGTRFIYSTARKITKAGLQNCSSDLLPINSLILSTRAPIGHLVINKTEMAMNQGCKGLIPNRLTSHDYLYYCLSYNKRSLSDLGAGNTFKELSASSLKNFEISIPVLPEQQKIADCLSSIDELVAAQTQKLATLKTHKKGLMQQLFPALDEVTT